MPDERSQPTPEQLEELGLSADDLAAMDDGVGVGGEEDVEDNEPEVDTTTAPAGTGTEPATPPAAATVDEPAAPPPPPSGSRTEEPGQPAAAAPPSPAAAPIPTAPKPPDQSPWVPTVDRRPLALEGATIDTEGNVRIPAAAIPRLMGHMADRGVWQEREHAYQERIRELDPANNEKVLLSQLIADEMDAVSDPARGGSDEKLWAWVQEFHELLPRLQADAKTRAIAAENQRLRGRLEPIDQEAERQRIEPELQRDLGSYLDRYLELPQYQALKPERARLANRIWSIKDRLIGRATQDYPEHGLQRGQFYVVFEQLEQELGFALDLLKGQKAGEQTEAERNAAEARNKAALRDPSIPPTPSATGAALPATGDKSGRPKTREEWQERMDRLASTP